MVIPTPVYYPFLSVPGNADQTGIQVPLVRDGRRWVMDFDALEAAITPASRIVLLSNPQNPTGRAYTEPELTALVQAMKQLISAASSIITAENSAGPIAAKSRYAT